MIPAGAAVEASISGTVTTSGVSTLANVTVDVHRSVGNNEFEFVKSVAVGARGAFHIDKLPPGSYRVEFYSNGKFLPHFYAGSSTLTDATEIRLATNQNRTGVDARLIESASIEGRVSNADGTANLNTMIILYRRDPSAIESSGQEVSQTYTDSSGSYRFDELPEGTYTLEFEPWDRVHLPEFWGDKTTLTAANDVVLAAGESRSAVNASLAKGAEIRGSVLDPDGERVREGFVRAYAKSAVGNDAPWVERSNALLTGNGTYRLGGLPAGTYRIEFGSFGEQLSSTFWGNSNTIVQASDIVLGAGQVRGDVTAALAWRADARGQTKLVNKAIPKISGNPLVGSTLQASDGSWTELGISPSYQWYAGGTKIASATSSSFRLTPAFLGKTITVHVRATKPGFETSAEVRSAGTAKVGYASSLSVKAKASKKRKVDFAVTTKANGKAVRGKVVVYRAGKKVKTVSLNSKGKATVKLTKQPLGKQKYTLAYSGSGHAKPVSRALSVNVKK